MTKISKGAKSGDVLGPFQTFLDQNYWAIGRNETGYLCFNYYAIIACFYYGKLKKYKTPHNSFKNIEESKFNELPLEITKCDKISIFLKI